MTSRLSTPYVPEMPLSQSGDNIVHLNSLIRLSIDRKQNLEKKAFSDLLKERKQYNRPTQSGFDYFPQLLSRSTSPENASVMSPNFRSSSPPIPSIGSPMMGKVYPENPHWLFSPMHKKSPNIKIETQNCDFTIRKPLSSAGTFLKDRRDSQTPADGRLMQVRFGKMKALNGVKTPNMYLNELQLEQIKNFQGIVECLSSYDSTTIGFDESDEISVVTRSGDRIESILAEVEAFQSRNQYKHEKAQRIVQCDDVQLEKWLADYEAEVTSFDSVSLFAELRLKEFLALEKACGPVPIPLRAAIISDLILRVCSSLGRYSAVLEPLIQELFKCVYSNYPNKPSGMLTSSSTSSINTETKQSTPKTTKEFFNLNTFAQQLVDAKEALSLYEKDIAEYRKKVDSKKEKRNKRNSKDGLESSTSIPEESLSSSSL